MLFGIGDSGRGSLRLALDSEDARHVDSRGFCWEGKCSEQFPTESRFIGGPNAPYVFRDFRRGGVEIRGD